MATYREIHGRPIQAVTTDPTVSVAEGQIWYNTTTNKFKSVLVSEAWSSGGPLSTGRYYAGGAGTQTAGLVFGGNVPPYSTATEEYNGSGWSTGGSLSTARTGMVGTGTQTAGLCVGGWQGSANQTVVEHYDGTSWTAGTAYPTGTRYASVVGILTAAVTAGGYDTNYSAQSNEYDGSTWTEAPNINTARGGAGRSGTQTAGLIFGGDASGSSTTAAEDYNGSTWTTGTSLNTPTRNSGSSAAGTNTAALNAGGTNTTVPGVISATETWDGSTWTTSPASLATARQGLAGMGTSTAGLVAGGEPPTTGATEEYNKSATVITAAAWASSGNVPVSIRGGGSGGTKDGAWMSGGLKNSPSTDRNDTYLYDGSSWTAGNDLPNNYFVGGGTGPQTAGLLWNGIVSGGGPATSTYEFDGTNWTSGGSFPAIGPNGSQGSTGAGVGQTAAVAMGGTGDPPPASSDRMVAYDGSTWSSDESMPQGVVGCAADGPNTAIWIAGGYSNPDTTSTSSQEYDGSSWTATGSLVNAAPQGLQFQGWGPQTSAIIAGGSSGGAPNNHNCQQYNGTIWVTAASLGTGRNNHAFCSKTAGTKEGFVAGGYEDSGNTNATEEFTDESTALNVKTLTQS